MSTHEDYQADAEQDAQQDPESCAICRRATDDPEECDDCGLDVCGDCSVEIEGDLERQGDLLCLWCLALWEEDIK